MIAPTEVMNAIIPVARFENGGVNEIINEVKSAGFKIVVQNDSPALVLLKPEIYENMKEILIEYQLLEITKERLENWDGTSVPAQEVYKDLGIDIDQDEYNAIPMEYGVDWE